MLINFHIFWKLMNCAAFLCKWTFSIFGRYLLISSRFEHILQRATICGEKHENYDKTSIYSKSEKKAVKMSINKLYL